MIATLAERAREQGIDVMVVTGDRDTFQLVEDGVRVMATGRGITDTKIYDREAVVDRYGIPPEPIPDFYGLKGDTSDNIPGVPGIGDKTAAQLLQRFGDLETVLASVDEISGAKRKENLLNHADDARVSKQLATSIRDVPVELDLDGSLAREPDRSRLRETFREFELRDPLRRLEEALGDEDAAAPRAEPSARVAARARKVAGLRPSADLKGVACHAGGGPARARRGPAARDGGGAAAALRRLRRRRRGADGRGARRARGAARGLGRAARGGARLEDARDARRTRRWRRRSSTTRWWPPTSSTPPGAATRWRSWRRRPGLGAKVSGGDALAEQAVLTRALAERQRALLEELDLIRLLEEVELPLVDVLVEMERAGVKLDVATVRTIAARLGDEAAELEREIWELAGEEFTIGSPQQLGPILFDKLGLSQEAPRQDRLLHRRPRAPGHPLRARDRPQDRGRGAS